MKSLARVGMLVEVRAVEARQPVRVAGKMRRHPVEDHADAAPVQVVDEVHEVLRRAVARGRREVAGHLVAPGAVEGMLHHRQQLHVREAELGYVVGERVRQLAIAQVAVVLLSHTPPGADVQLVDRPGRGEGVAARAPLQPVGVVPLIVELPHDRRGARRQPRRETRKGRTCRPRSRQPRRSRGTYRALRRPRRPPPLPRFPRSRCGRAADGCRAASR